MGAHARVIGRKSSMGPEVREGVCARSRRAYADFEVRDARWALVVVLPWAMLVDVQSWVRPDRVQPGAPSMATGRY